MSEELNELLAYPEGEESQTINDIVDGVNMLIGTICAKKLAFNHFAAVVGIPFRFSMDGC